MDIIQAKLILDICYKIDQRFHLIFKHRVATNYSTTVTFVLILTIRTERDRNADL